MKNKKGFTLVELIVVIVIIGILASILIPNLSKWIEKSKIQRAEAEASEKVKEFIYDKTFDNSYNEFTMKNFIVFNHKRGYVIYFENNELISDKTTDNINNIMGYYQDSNYIMVGKFINALEVGTIYYNDTNKSDMFVFLRID